MDKSQESHVRGPQRWWTVWLRSPAQKHAPPPPPKWLVPALTVQPHMDASQRCAVVFWWAVFVGVIALVARKGRGWSNITAAVVLTAVVVLAVYFVVFVLHPRRDGFATNPMTSLAQQCKSPGESGTFGSPDTASEPAPPEQRLMQPSAASAPPLDKYGDGPLCEPRAAPSRREGPAGTWRATPIQDVLEHRARPDYDAMVRAELFLRQEYVVPPESDVGQLVTPITMAERPGPTGGVW